MDSNEPNALRNQLRKECVDGLMAYAPTAFEITAPEQVERLREVLGVAYNQGFLDGSAHIQAIHEAKMGWAEGGPLADPPADE
jgi:hypothetical protein